MKYKLPISQHFLLFLLALNYASSTMIYKPGNGSVAHYNYENEYREFVRVWAESVNGISGPTAGSKIRPVRSVCRLSEFSCGSTCIAGDRYCNGVVDCPDSSDEFTGCSPCNRTYYGDYGSTYSISLTSQGHGDNSLKNSHFVCQLTFAAAGGEFGDLVQIMFESINIGRLSSPMIDGCTEGSLQVAEISRPATGGSWCGSGTGHAAYYSEMSAVALTLSIGGRNGSASISSPNNSTILHTNVNTDKTVFTATEQGLNYEFKIRFKFLPKGGAVVRYGPVNQPLERGELVPGTYCSRVLDTCHQKSCKIQSPNYPGLYPRNTTCYFTIRQREVPPCKRVLIKVGQARPHKVQLRSIGGKVVEGGGDIVSWDDCDLRDMLIFYDGTSTDDRVLLKICGGNTLPEVVGSGPDLLVAFHSTPYGNPLDPHPLPPYPLQLRGFELDVEVLVIDSFSSEVVNGRGACLFVYTSGPDNHPGGVHTPQEFGGNWIGGKAGVVSSPRHTLPPGTKCRYEFRGADNENVWIYFTVYRRGNRAQNSQPVLPPQGPQAPTAAPNCTTRLRILDSVKKGTEVPIGNFCDGEVPRICDHKALQNETRHLRACSMSESYVSAGSGLVLEQSFGAGTALHSLHYRLNYEFIRRHTTDPPTCHRYYRSRHMRPTGTFRTSDNVFDFGRGGSPNITCRYIIELAPLESLTLQLVNASFGREPSCRTVSDPETGRHACEYFEPNSHLSEIRLSEYIWPGSNLSSHTQCLCGNTSGQAFLFLGRRIELNFTVTGMKGEDSYETHYGEFSYRVNKGGGCRGDNHLMGAESGLISLESSYGQRPPSCSNYPYLIQSVDNNSLYLRIPGFTMMGGRNESERICPTTRNRILIYNNENVVVQKVCPASYHQLGRTTAHAEVYSEDFREYSSPLYASLHPAFKIEFIGRELGNYRIHWLQLVSARMVAALGAVERDKVRMGEAARTAGGGLNGTGVEKGAGPWEDPLWSSMFEEDLIGPQSQNDNPPQRICQHYCPELQACISPELWCDGEVHCPVTLADEVSCDSFWLTLGQILSPAVYLPVAAGILSALACCFLVLICICVKRLILRGKKSGREAGGRRRLPPRDLFIEPYDEGS